MHRKDNRKGLLFRHVFTLAVLAAVAASLLAMLLFTTASQANAQPSGRYKADNATCRDFWAWDSHPTPARFAVLVRISRHADTYLRVDVRGLAHELHTHYRKGAELYASYVAMACTFTGDQGV